MVAPAADTRMSHLAYVVAAVNLGGVIVLLVMYIVEIPRGVPYIFGSSSDWITADSLNVKQTSVGCEADLPQNGQISQSFPNIEIARVIDRGFRP